MELNHMQSVAVTEFSHWYDHPETRTRNWYEISGAAGTGKTTVVKEIIKYKGFRDDEVVFCAYVGKATLALRLTGIDARTIHNTIYDLQTVPVTVDGEVVYKEKFVKKPHLSPNLKLIVLDEAGMVGGQIAEDLLSFGIPLLLLGDLNQLPPVMGKRRFLQHPDVILNEIMRQAKDSSIIYLSQLAIHGILPPYGETSKGDALVLRKDELTDDHLRESDIIICNTNRMRDTINAYVRTNICNIHSNRIVIGDKLICRKNMWDTKLNDDIALVNGTIGYVDCVYYETKNSTMAIDFRPEFSTNEYFKKLPINANYPFLPYERRKESNTRFVQNAVFEFGHAITCHLSQGSQYDTVLVYLETWSGKSLYDKQWLYTAITRAKKKIILVI